MKTWRIGRILGFPIEVNLTFLLMLGVVFVTMGGLAGVASVLFAFASVLVHELGHAVVARRLGVPIVGIEMHFFGGAAKMGAQPRSARDEILIAAAGPAVSLALAGVGLTLGAVTGFQLLTLLGAVNLVLGGFNLVPALPMDGGRILRAALASRLGFLRGTEVAVKVARVFTVLFVVASAWFGSFQLLLLAGMVWYMGTRELAAARLFGGYRSGAGSPAYAATTDGVDFFQRAERPPLHPESTPLAGGAPRIVYVRYD